MMVQFVEILLVGMFTLLLATGVFYECLCLLVRFVGQKKLSARALLYTMMLGLFLAHGLVIIIYALVYWFLIHYAGYADLAGQVTDHFLSYLYYSATSYSSLGIGDVFPEGELRFLTALEAINGLILITWSATTTYFAIQKMWDKHDVKYRL